MKILSGTPKIFRHPKGGALKKLRGGRGSENLYTLNPKGRGGGLLKI